MTLVAAFRDELGKRIQARGLRLSWWPGGTRTSSHLLQINTSKPTVLYVKESNTSPGFWGLTRSQLERLNGTDVRWFAVLLLRSPDVGYLLSGGQVNLRIEDGTFELSRDGDHKVNESTDLVDAQAFQNLDEVVARVL